jgi:K+-sensing histidine kinase KdpD
MATNTPRASICPQRYQLLITRYGLAVVVTVLAAVFRVALTPLWGREVPLIMFYPAIMASAWFGGLGPGLTTTLLSALTANYLFMEPGFSLRLNVGTIVALGMFVGIGVFISAITEALKRGQNRLVALIEREQAARAEAERVAQTVQQLQLAMELPLSEVSIDAVMRDGDDPAPDG